MLRINEVARDVWQYQWPVRPARLLCLDEPSALLARVGWLAAMGMAYVAWTHGGGARWPEVVAAARVQLLQAKPRGHQPRDLRAPAF
eukprot:7256631-Lingulodinium_polyedra.AAC.1